MTLQTMNLERRNGATTDCDSISCYDRILPMVLYLSYRKSDQLSISAFAIQNRLFNFKVWQWASAMSMLNSLAKQMVYLCLSLSLQSVGFTTDFVINSFVLGRGPDFFFVRHNGLWALICPTKCYIVETATKGA